MLVRNWFFGSHLALECCLHSRTGFRSFPVFLPRISPLSCCISGQGVSGLGPPGGHLVTTARTPSHSGLEPLCPPSHFCGVFAAGDVTGGTKGLVRSPSVEGPWARNAAPPPLSVGWHGTKVPPSPTLGDVWPPQSGISGKISSGDHCFQCSPEPFGFRL